MLNGNSDGQFRGFSRGQVKAFTYKGQVWCWNGFWSFFFQPVGPNRKRERIIKEGHRLYPLLQETAGYP